VGAWYSMEEEEESLLCLNACLFGRGGGCGMYI
jgi:hypothetical protein